jgi:hypothetical protein
VNAKQMGTHIAWTLTAEAVHRLAARSIPEEAGKSFSRAAKSREKETGYEEEIEAAGS